MTLKCCSFLLLLCSVAAAQIDVIQRDWVLAGQPLKWEAPPRKIQSTKRAALADLIVLYPSGTFAQVSCYLFRQPNGHISISRGDSHAVILGNWILTGRVVLAKARLVYADALLIGKPIPGPEMTFQLKVTSRGGARWLQRDGRTFKPLPNLSDLEFFAAVVNCDRSFWDGHEWQEGMQLPCMSPLENR
jgi:hypothetical protein